jgi:hypothetical protein
MVLVDMDVLTESLFALSNEIEVLDSHLEMSKFRSVSDAAKDTGKPKNRSCKSVFS